jgi:hypothetical protein
MKFIIASLLFAIISFKVYSQQAFISGTIKDSTNSVAPVNGVVTLLSSTDSLMMSFARIQTDGSYKIKKPKAGRYFILVAHPGFADYLDTVTVHENTETIIPIFLTSKKKLVEDIIIKARVAPIVIKGDTVVFTADSFKVKDGANVEDLLRKLPGLQVDRNGEVKAMGEKVKKVLVDGEEFFGSDPGVAVKNLQANAVDKVEVFDKKSDQAAFTGIDDGVSEKTINLKLKGNKKNGYFGKIEASGGTPDNYDMQAMINAFKAKRKLSIFTTSGNIGNTELGWNDNQQFSGSTDLNLNNDETDFYYGDYDDFTNFYNGANGIPKNWNTGAHYSNKFKADKNSINVFYRYNKINAIAVNNTYATTFLPDSVWNNNSNSTNLNSKERHIVGMIYETKLDSNNIIKVSLGLTAKQADVLTNVVSDAFTDQQPINRNSRNMVANNESINYIANILWLHKFAKKNRTFSWGLGTNINNNESNGILTSLNTFYSNGALSTQDTVDQEKQTLLSSQQWSSKLSYTEPLSKKITAELSLHTALNNADNNRKSLDKDTEGKYTKLATVFSNHFTLNTVTQTPGLFFKYAHKKLTINVGTKIGFNQFKQTNISNNTKFTYNFVNHFPSVSFYKKLKGNSGLRLRFDGRGIAPGYEQLQPIQDNTNPLFITVGNPDLKQSFDGEFSITYNKWNVIKSNGIWSRVSFTSQHNAFTSFSTIDSLGRTVSKTVNVNGNYNGYLNFNYSFKVQPINTSINIGPVLNINNRNDFINELQNEARNFSYGISVGFSKSKEDKQEETIYNIWTDVNIVRNTNNATISKSSQANFWSLSGAFNSTVRIFWKMILENNIDLDYRQKDPRFPRNNNLTLWNVSLTKDIVKNTFLMSFRVNDLLNQNRGFNRNFNSFTYTETFNNVLQRYWVLKAVYKFNSQKVKKK